MKFSLPFFHKRQEANPYYLGLFLKEEEGTVFYIKKRGHKFEVVASEGFTTSAGWDSLVEDLDEILFRLEKGQGIAPDQTIFFVYSHLIDEASRQIKRPFLDKIKTVVKNLDLKPLGYIDTHEAVVEGIQLKEDIPLTAVLIEADASNLQLFVYKGGKVLFKDHIARSSDIVEDITPFLKEVREKVVLPSRIILYDGGHLHEVAGRIINHKWGEEFFIQLPKVEVVSGTELQSYLLHVFANQMAAPQEAVPVVPDAKEDTKEDAVGVMGFVIGGEVKSRPPREDHQESPAPHIPVATAAAPWTGMIGGYLAPLKDKAQVFMKKLQSGSFPILPVAGVALILVALISMELFFHKATVTLYLPSEEVAKKLTIPAGDPPAAGELAVKSDTTTLQSEGTRTTTGKKEVGKKAKGEVTLHNFSDSQMQFAKGAGLTSDNLKFVLLDDVQVASSSLASDGSAKLPGKKNAGAEASALGDEYNLAAGKRFTIGDLSSATYFGINENALTGGSRKEVRVVSAADLEALKKSILKAATDSLKKKLASLPGSRKIIDALSDQEISEFKPSAQADDEADQVTGTGGVSATYYYFDDKELRALLAKKLSSSASSGHIIDAASLSYSVTSAKKSSDTITLAVSVKGRAGPTVSRDEILRAIVGKETKLLLEIVKGKYKAEGIDYEVAHPFPFFRGMMPLFKKNIEMKVTYRSQK